MWDDDEDFETLPARRMRGIDIVVMGIELISRMFRVFSGWSEEIVEIVGAHANWQLEQERNRTTPVAVTP